MAEPDDPVRPRPSAPGYLPRLWKAAPEPEPEVEEPPPGAGKRRRTESSDSDGVTSKVKKKSKKATLVDEGPTPGKLEETPVLDTYEARQRARWIIGGIVSAIGLLGLLLVVRAFRGNATDQPAPSISQPRTVVDARANAEVEARNIVENARQADKSGKTQAAVTLLEKVAKAYQTTAAGREAMAALDRQRRSRPLFGPDLPEQASGPEPPPAGYVPPAAPVTGGTPGPVAPSPPPKAETPNPAVVVQAPPPVPIKPLPTGFREKMGATIHESGWPTRILSDRDGSEMVLVPGGSFLMGREDGEPAERPAHRVSLSTYYIDLHEVTVRQFIQFLKETGRPLDAARLSPRETSDPPSTEDYPVVNVSAPQAKAYCNWAHKRLPTEAQWEFAARSFEGKISYWNGELPRKDPERGHRTVEPVMSLPSDLSPFGVFDMAANAWEWTGEYWDSQYYQQFRNPVLDPAGPRQSRSRIVEVTVKGGSKSGILTWRDGQKLETRLPYLGFRGALPVEGLPAATPATNPNATPNPELPGGVVPF